MCVNMNIDSLKLSEATEVRDVSFHSVVFPTNTGGTFDKLTGGTFENNIIAEGMNITKLNI